ncbi:MAG: class I SAM-dependent methyltransferase [Atribacterota bacterium]|nr:class I SAM-dependent methyltransferase [Atribacterota bacterium]
MESNIKNTKCACGFCDYQKLFERKDANHNFEIVKCKNCGLIRTFPVPDYSRARYESYGIEKYLKNKKLVVSFMKMIFKEVRRFKKKGRLLEIGCNLGYFLEVAKNNGFEVRGIDLDKEAVNYANNNLGEGIVLQSTLEEAKFPDAYFDVVVISHVLEHIPDIKKFLKEIKGLLNDKGIVMIASPNLDGFCAKIKKEKWPGLRPDEHVWQLNESTIKKLLKEEGFLVARIKTSGLCHNFASVIKEIKENMREKGPLKQSFYSVLNWLCGKFGTGDNVFVVAINKKNS